ncbi:MAG: hypothetical protein Q7K54_00940 [Candidatus Parcubacteria bacterium]|nr:hypothetical protein [Candidatus Parcubacteria bacterium]
MQLFGKFIVGRKGGLVLNEVACEVVNLPKQLEKIGTCDIEAPEELFKDGILPRLICFPSHKGNTPEAGKWYEVSGFQTLRSGKACITTVGIQAEPTTDMPVWRKLNTRYGRATGSWEAKSLPGYNHTGRRGQSRVSVIFERI